MMVSPWKLPIVLVTVLIGCSTSALAQRPVVPGTGVKLTNVGDDFEDVNWKFIPNFPKSSDEQDERRREPAGPPAR